MPAIVRFQPGEIQGYITIINLTREMPNSADRLYRVRRDCCGTETEMSHSAIRDTVRKRRECCARCAILKKRAGGQFKGGDPVQRGAVMGPVTVIGPGSAPGRYAVRWSCCGAEDERAVGYLYKLKSWAADGYHGLCRDCYADKRAGRLSEPVVAAEELPYWQREPLLPPGLISAAAAWPRPRLGA